MEFDHTELKFAVGILSQNKNKKLKHFIILILFILIKTFLKRGN